MSSKGPVTKEQISKIIAEGIEEGAQKASAKGIPVEKARAQALERLRNWASNLAEQDMLTPVKEEKSKNIGSGCRYRQLIPSFSHTISEQPRHTG